ncbi:bone marrow stromal antigen 2 [Saccopteryx bilineata]|uniref:bone marrow stromal antigen 2 n=1 Tax=Saccopteryx bilineata TaxID=59482 RepID=UPI00338E3C8B
MAPTLYHYLPVPMKLGGNKLMKRMWFPLLLLVVAILFVLLIIFGVKANSKACKDGLRAEQECWNSTQLLKHQLIQAQEVLAETEGHAASCNMTVVTLTDSLEKEKAQGHRQQELVQELQGEIEKLKQELQHAHTKLEQLRKKDKSCTLKTNSNPGNSLSPLEITALLTLNLWALLA